MSIASLKCFSFFTGIMGLMTATAYANVAIFPIKMHIDGDNRQRTTTINIHASADESPKNYEVKAYKWTQDKNGHDVLTPDHQLIISPASFVLEPSTQQKIRMGFKQAITTMNLQQEQAWRIKITPLPDIQQSNGIQYAYGFNIPLFVGQNFKPEMSFQIIKQTDRHSTLYAKNIGNGHIQITGFNIIDAKGKMLYQSNEMKYVLAHQQVTFSVPSIQPQSGLQVMIKNADNSVSKFDLAESLQ